ncbi:MAG TPA: TetR/AcrR family transcriptional regulator C-terminal domain-containing protein [Acidimicrobiales bacterium]|jgi:AcrR family transcriptional regulator
MAAWGAESAIKGARRRTPGERAPRGTISRSKIVEAALRSLGTIGFEQMTIRSLAAELDVAPMSLYRYIRDKDDLMDEVVEELLKQSQPLPAAAGSWQSRLTAAAEGLRRLLVGEPAALYVYLRHPIISATALRRMELMLKILREAGYDAASSKTAYAAIQTYTVGFAALQTSRADWTAPEGTSRAASELVAMTSPKQFASGLGYLLSGIEHEAGRTAQ